MFPLYFIIYSEMPFTLWEENEDNGYAIWELPYEAAELCRKVLMYVQLLYRFTLRKKVRVVHSEFCQLLIKSVIGPGGDNP